ncbi:carbohydrate ABC transporter permease [Streptacidiphilus sp. N1-3]|uniref:Carbohydrate ABC transporter permease n=1 Tax=Streptacidiphilus alkalitolerans TaxID=3342712 RepID=A0ABV6WZJ6_9ACTN
MRVDAPAPPRRSRWGGATGPVFVSLYTVLLLAFGLGPTGYAIYLSMTNASGQFTGLGQYVKAFGDFRFAGAFVNIGTYLALWLVTLLVLVVVLALMLHRLGRWASSALRFMFYLPGALAGVASVLVWLFMLDPSASPFSSVLHLLGQDTLADTILPSHLALVFVVIAFWTGAGGWIIVMYGALNNIPLEVLDAAKVDGASTLQLAWHIEIPMIKKWIYYMLILAFATGTQLFVEPQLVYAASGGDVSPTWSPNELAYTFAFQNGNFNQAAAVSICLLLLSLIVALFLVFRSGLFDVEEDA